MIVLCTHVSPSDEGGVASSARFFVSSLSQHHSFIWVKVPTHEANPYMVYLGLDHDVCRTFNDERLLIDYLKKRKIANIIVHFVTFSVDFGLNLKRAIPSSKLILNFRGNDATLNVFREENCLEIYINKSDLLVYVSDHLKRLVETRYESAVGKGIVVNNSPKSDGEIITLERKDRLSRIPVLQYGAIGFWKWKKGLSVLLEYLRNNPQFAKSFRLYGEIDARDPNLLALYEAVVQECGMSPIKAIAPKDVPRILGGIDVLVIPSLAEGVPNVLLEGYTNGCFIVASNIPGIQEIVEKAGHGITFQPGEAFALESAINELERDREAIGRYLSDIPRIKDLLNVNPWNEINQALA
ncbi:MAG: glycosyltransferase family 4 protein [Candidatus Thiodiazotropha sp.]